MAAISFETPLQFIKGVGPKLGDRLKDLGLFTVGDLMHYYPRAYEDRRAARSIESLEDGELVSLRAQIVGVSAFYLGRSKKRAWDVIVKDETGRICCKFFRAPYRGYFERFQPGQSVRVVGKVANYRGRLEFHHPDLQDDHPDILLDDDVLLPIYPESMGISNRILRKLVRFCLDQIDAQRGAENISDPLPVSIKKNYQLMGLFDAIRMIHRPPKDASTNWALERSSAHRRLIFEEFFWLELYLAAKKQGLHTEPALKMKPATDLKNRLLSQLPFALTNAQIRSLQEIEKDLTGASQRGPMHRLVQGDVGSGKTMVALLAALTAIENGYQVAMMVPTEILAEQHDKTAQKLFELLGLKVGLFTGSLKTKERAQAAILLENGQIDLAIGTHALIEDGIQFKNLGLVIIDEQHRFGVEQRGLLKQKGVSPHFLVMTATPIPRTLAMTVYGDLEVSVIDELPAGRQPIQTRIGREPQRQKMYDFVRGQLEKGRQAYFVYPLVEESEKLDLKNATEEFDRIQTEFSDFNVGLLHGRMKAEEKEAVMQKFRHGQIAILVATTVIEVGVDVPNANVMVIEHSERFGLSQLHQLRGRVGRGEFKSFCLLMMGYAASEEARVRLEIMEASNDGFKIAEEDLKIRGPGEFLGTKQSGLPGFRIANLVKDVDVLQEARAAAFSVFLSDRRLQSKENSSLKDYLFKNHGPVAMASIG